MHYQARNLEQRLHFGRLDRQFLETYSQTRERPPHAQAEWITYPHNAEHRWEANGTHCWQKIRQIPRGDGDTPRRLGGFRPVQCTRENTASFASDVCEGFQRKEQAVSVAIDLQDAYNRVHSSG